MTLLMLLFGILLAASLTIAVLIGTRLPKTHVAASRAYLPQAPEDVWHAIRARNDYPLWRPGIARIEMAETDGLATWTEFCVRNLGVSFVETVNEPPRRLVTQLAGEPLVVAGEWTYDLTPSGAGTLLTITESGAVHHPLMRFFTRYILSYHGTMDVFLIALGRYLGSPVQPEHLSVERTDNGMAPPTR
jgi:hypothetical protein